MKCSFLRPAALLCGLAFAAASASAHDTWFERSADPSDAQGSTWLTLGTGNQFPKYDSGIDPRYLVQQGCRAGKMATSLHAVRSGEEMLLLRGVPGAATCWAQLAPFDITLAPDKIPIYLRELNLGPELLATWAAMQARGLPWKERYTKNARIELGPPSTTSAPLGLDLVITNNAGRPVRMGDTLAVQVLRDGQPLAGLAVELRSPVSPLGIWRRSDAEGRLQMPVPTLRPGPWLLRAIDLRVSATDPDSWDSRFVTLAFDVQGPGPVGQNGISLSSNALSTSHTEASTAISSEPPSSTARR